jgi:arsenate reductase
MSHVIYHNPSCGTSRAVLAALREAGIAPVVVLYMETPLDAAQLAALAQAMGEPARALLRTREALCGELGLDTPDASEERIFSAIAAHPILFNRPVVSGPRGTRVCRPAEVVQDLL